MTPESARSWCLPPLLPCARRSNLRDAACSASILSANSVKPVLFPVDCCPVHQQDAEPRVRHPAQRAGQGRPAGALERDLFFGHLHRAGQPSGNALIACFALGGLSHDSPANSLDCRISSFSESVSKRTARPAKNVLCGAPRRLDRVDMSRGGILRQPRRPRKSPRSAQLDNSVGRTTTPSAPAIRGKTAPGALNCGGLERRRRSPAIYWRPAPRPPCKSRDCGLAG